MTITQRNCDNTVTRQDNVNCGTRSNLNWIENHKTHEIDLEDYDD